MISSQRNLFILNRLKECGIIDYKNISKELGVSEATIRRDFEKLEKSGKLRRVQGGAMPNDDMHIGELSISAKHGVDTSEKLEVAQFAAKEVKDGECVFLDIGTSIAPLGEILLNKPVQIITNSNLILRLANSSTKAELHVVGGQYIPEDQMFIGPYSEAMLRECAFDRAFIGCMGVDIDKNAVYVTDINTYNIKQIAMKNAREKILLVNQTKLNKVGLFRLCGTDDFDRVYIDGTKPTCKMDNLISTQ